MSKKIYEKGGYKIDYKKFIYIFNLPLENGYDWYISTSPCEKEEAVGIKRKDKGKSVSRTCSLNYIRRMYHLY